MNEKKKIVISGYVSMDHMLHVNPKVQSGQTSLVKNRTFQETYFGGCSVNIACGLRRLGMDARPMIRVGQDFAATGFKSYLESIHMPIDHIQVVENEMTSTCYLLQDSEGEHITLFYPGAMDEKYAENIPAAQLEEASLGVITVASYKDNRYFFDRCQELGIPVAFGMKDDRSAFPKQFLKELLDKSRIIFMNESESQMLRKTFALQELSDLLSGSQDKILIVTKGRQGSSYYEKRSGEIYTGSVDICRPHTVVDTTGSGDAYMAGFLYGYLCKEPTAACCRMGSVMSSFVIEEEGCVTNLPDRGAFIDRYEKHVKGETI